MIASECGYVNVVTYLLSLSGINVNATDRRGQTALHFAAIHGHESIVKILLRLPSIQRKLTDRYGLTPLNYAIEKRHHDVTKLLCRQDALENYVEHIEYNDSSAIPFIQNGNSALIGRGVERVILSSNRCKLVRRTILVHSPRGEDGETWQLRRKIELAQEACIIKESRHKHVIQIFQVYFDNANKRRGEIRFAVVMDRADRNLRHYLRKNCPEKLDERWFSCLLGAVCHIHTLGLLHKSIKPENILIKNERVLLTDFGLSKTAEIMDRRHSKWNPLFDYRAPEEDGVVMSQKQDIFALGAVFFEMIITLNYPDRLEKLKSILGEPCPADGIMSYAANIDKVHVWIEKLDWQNSRISMCRKMLLSDQNQRLDDLYSILSLKEWEGCACVDTDAW